MNFHASGYGRLLLCTVELTKTELAYQARTAAARVLNFRKKIHASAARVLQFTLPGSEWGTLPLV